MVSEPAAPVVAFTPGLTTLRDAHRELTLATLKVMGWNYRKAAECLGVTPRTVYNHVQAWRKARLIP